MIRPDRDKFFSNREIYKLLSDWEQLGDRAVITEYRHNPVTTAWLRLLAQSNRMFVFIDSRTPEL